MLLYLCLTWTVEMLPRTLIIPADPSLRPPALAPHQTLGILLSSSAAAMETAAEASSVESAARTAVFRDIRRYYCEFCGLCRSKKSLLRAHLLSHHKEEMGEPKVDAEEKGEEKNKCGECGATFRKPAYLKQHMRGHRLERPFACPLDDCHCSYRRKDHLNRHLLKHQGKFFSCPMEKCERRFAFHGNVSRHVKAFHGSESPSVCEKLHVCQEEGCGKIFKYASQLRKHEDSHVQMEYVEAICGEPSCMKVFTNSECLKTHIKTCHQFVRCEVCGSKQLKKNFKRHRRMHEGGGETERINCTFEGCQYSFSNRSNLTTHVKAIHQELRPFTCRMSGCGKKFSYRQVRDNHEKSSAHVYVQGDFVEADEQFRLRPRGGRKRKCCMPVEALFRRRVLPPGQSSTLDDGTEYLRWLLSDDQQ